ncbi:MAG: hypothetical protein Cons2KO_18910 [Congregibacter sp.]
MTDIPRITIDSDHIVVDDVQYRKHLFRPAYWLVGWRSIHDADLTGTAVVTRHDRFGVGSLGDEQFKFAIRWCIDRRRPLLSRYEPGTNRAPAEVVGVGAPVLAEAPVKTAKYF